jgi:hypothetical protein
MAELAADTVDDDACPGQCHAHDADEVGHVLFDMSARVNVVLDRAEVDCDVQEAAADDHPESDPGQDR